MTRLKTGAKNKLRKARIRVEKVVLMEIRKNIEQQRKWKAKLTINRSASAANSVATSAKN